MATVHELRLRNASEPHGWRRFAGSVARSLYAGFFVGLIAGFLTLLVSIVSVAIGELLFHRALIEIPLIYRAIAPSVAVSIAVLVFFGNLVWERTHPAPART